MARKYAQESKEKPESNEDDELLAKIRENFNIAQDCYSDQRQEAEEDFKFRKGDQWDDTIKVQRQNDGRPCLVVNKLGQFIRQVVNDQKKNRPSINVNPGDSQARIEVAQVLQAIIKNIESQSMAENAYDTAFDNCCTGGEGYFRIITEYSDPMSFDQEIRIKPIDNPFSVFIDPNFRSDFSNIEWAFIFDEISKEKFEREYPDSKWCSGDIYLQGQDTWISPNSVRIAEYFYIDYVKQKIVLLKNGEIMLKEEYDKLEPETKKITSIVKERETYNKVVKWVKTNGHEILESTEFPGQYIPIVPVFADTFIVEGKRYFEGMIRQAKDPQRAYNFWNSAEAEQLALAPKAPYIVAEGQIEGHEAEWNSLNSQNVPYLEYKPVSSGGTPAPPPQRTQFDPQITSILNAKQMSNEDLKATTGIYDPSLGMDQKEASGKALITKQRQAELTNFHYLDNLQKSLKYAGRILLDIIPIVYDTKRVVRIVGGVNEEDELKIINSFDEKDPIFLDIGKYDVEISMGPYGENQRQDSLESMLALMQISPDLVNVMGDIFVGKQDWPGAKEVSERLKIMLPPALQNNQELPPEIQAQIAQKQAEYEQKIQQDAVQMQAMQKMIADTTALLNKTEAELKNKMADIESKERIEAMKARVQLLVAGIKEDAQDSRLAFTQELMFTQQKQQGQAEIPNQKDVFVFPGVNDPITEESQEGEINPEDEHNLLAKLSQHNQNNNM